MITIADLEVAVQDRLEEQRGVPGVFWQVQNELRPIIVEAMNEAALITGEPQVRQGQLFTITAGTRLFALPAGSFALLRMESQNPVKKSSIVNLDRMLPGWEATVASAQDNTLQYWFPYGLEKFGVYPLLAADIQVFLTTVQLPVGVTLPYQGTEVIPYLPEYFEGIKDYSAHVARLKEGGKDFAASIAEYEFFLSQMKELSKYMDRKGVLRFSKSVGARSQVTDIQAK